jgi:transposase
VACSVCRAFRQISNFPAYLFPFRYSWCVREGRSRPIWRLLDGRAVLVAYDVYRGPRDEYGQIPGTLGRSEYGLEIIVAIAFLVYQVGLSFCLVLNFFQDLPFPSRWRYGSAADFGPM